MSRGLDLQQKLRKSEVLTEEDIYKDFMAYAKEVSDQLEIYIYMEENQIGTHVPQYWLARFQVMKRRCQFISLVTLLSKVKKIEDLSGWQIEYFETKLQKDLERIIYQTFRGKRKPSMLNIRQIPNLHPEKRKIGNIEVFVDEKCRHNYYLRDYAKYIEEEMKQYCSIQKQIYKRQQALKPPSFLAKKQLHLMEMAEQLLLKTGRRSHNARYSLRNNRFSNQNLLINTQNLKEQHYQTPKNNEQINIPKTPNRKQQMISGSRSRDSVEILKEMHQKHVFEKKSPRFGKDDEKEFFENKSDKMIQYCRSTKQHEDFCFSFGKNRKSFSSKKQLKRNDEQNSEKDDAFVIYSFSDDSNTKLQNSLAVKKEDFQLELIIKEIQRETYQKLESQTFSSEIDSNQENKYYLENQKAITFTETKRKPFGNIVLTDSGKLLKNHDYKLQQLMQFDDDRNPQKMKSFEKSVKKQINNHIPIFLSEQKRLSNISQQGSFFSESRRKHQKHRE